jgi:hypothetical protein
MRLAPDMRVFSTVDTDSVNGLEPLVSTQLHRKLRLDRRGFQARHPHIQVVILRLKLAQSAKHVVLGLQLICAEQQGAMAIVFCILSSNHSVIQCSFSIVVPIPFL